VSFRVTRAMVLTINSTGREVHGSWISTLQARYRDGYFVFGEEPPCKGMSSGKGGSRRGFSSRAWSRTSFRPLSLIAF
jgi:hypothetical protein